MTRLSMRRCRKLMAFSMASVRRTLLSSSKRAKECLNRRLQSQKEALTVSFYKWLAVLSLLLPGLVLAKDQTFSVENVAIDAGQCQKVVEDELQFSCHRFEPGAGFGVAYRKYTPATHVDNDSFEKLTIYLNRKPSTGQVITLPSDDAFVFFSSGPSSFPGKHGCYGIGDGGVIKIVDMTSNSTSVSVDLKLKMESVLGWKSQCNGSALSKKLDATNIAFDKLTPWLGLKTAAPSAWDDAHP